MGTSLQDLQEWFKRGKMMREKGNKPLYMVVVCDSFDHEDYPVYCYTEDAAREKIARPGEMQYIMEVYDLTKPFDKQKMSGRFCRAL